MHFQTSTSNKTDGTTWSFYAPLPFHSFLTMLISPLSSSDSEDLINTILATTTKSRALCRGLSPWLLSLVPKVSVMKIKTRAVYKDRNALTVAPAQGTRTTVNLSRVSKSAFQVSPDFSKNIQYRSRGTRSYTSGPVLDTSR